MKTKILTQNLIATELGITQGAVSGWFCGRTKPSIDNAIKLKQHFDIPIEAWSDIFSYIDNNSERFGAIKRLRRQHNGNTKV
ncbi:helix-turn-helix transcriptional regulator [Campylobacter mucosalis]|uniref:Putative transcriptional regulator, XRE family n=1 Tax=Campylobacter mucosalis CCUG 21559 TaxID=1032067 RepID=A0A6G5QH23_9BACT|nr:helix-turn-helix transcriptional regulator [Campylobacter mucosalis]QCD44932.1 putative transcriptional regulator, XRE family [Campylobacter mucosalis CCUG 21559]